MATEETACYRPFNHLKFFAGPAIVGMLLIALRLIYIHSSDAFAKSTAIILGIGFVVASIGVHVGCLFSYRDRHQDFRYRPTPVSAIVVSVIQLLMIAIFLVAILHLFKLPVHN